jgi:NAD(P)-dependent dehydrogenase (short-subunit alcohol dehydrogenase family)
LATDEVVSFFPCDFTAADCQLPGLPDVIHGAAYCPGSINLRSFRSLKVKDFQQDWQINVLGAVRFLQHCAGGLGKAQPAGRSSVVLFSTVAVAQGLPMHASIAASKGAIEGLTRSLAAEWAPKVRVNAIAPALTDTPLASKFFANPAGLEALAGRYPLARTGMPDDLAAAAEFLLSEQSTWITGQTLGIDGGMSTLRK